MKWQWTTDELIDEWTLLPDEEVLLANKSGTTRLGFAVLFKYFQHEGRFPHQKHEIPSAVITYLARLLTLPPELFLQYDWGGRQIKRHRMQIRAALGFHSAIIVDARALRDWLCDHVLSQDHRLERLVDLVYAECRERRIEPPTSERVIRLVRSAQRRFEGWLFESVMRQLAPSTRAALNALLIDAADLTEFIDEPEPTEPNEPLVPGGDSLVRHGATAIADDDDDNHVSPQISNQRIEDDVADMSAWNFAGILEALDNQPGDPSGDGERSAQVRERDWTDGPRMLTIQPSDADPPRSASAPHERGAGCGARRADVCAYPTSDRRPDPARNIRNQREFFDARRRILAAGPAHGSGTNEPRQRIARDQQTAEPARLRTPTGSLRTPLTARAPDLPHSRRD